ncbi:MAG: hypothetical protein HUU41_17895, partial [Bryobacteraceae bacterium]|nr:hypothetical protein [Bryobacteraceae bacterium]
RDPKVGLYEPVLALAADTARTWREQTAARRSPDSFVLIAGLCGRTPQACREAAIAKKHGYHAGLLSLGAWARDDDRTVLRHCRAVAREIPLIGFYLQPAVGGRVFSYGFWRAFAEIPQLVAIKIAPFHRYRTIDVVRAVLEAGRDDVALYTGNDDNIIGDLITPFEIEGVSLRIAGGLLGQWAVWTRRAVEMRDELLSVPGIDAVMIGPVDLSISYGVPGDFQHPKMVEAMELIKESCEKHGVAPGTQTRTVALAKFWRDRGMRFLGCSGDTTMLFERAKDLVSQLSMADGAAR